jgi:hypothetical protein
MHTSIEDWKNGWFGVKLAMAPEEIDRLIELLRAVKADSDQHFHVSSDYKAVGGLGDVELSVKEPSQSHNLFLSGLALAPGDEI